MKRNYILIVLCLLVSLFIYMFYRTEKTVINDLFVHLLSCDRFVSLQKTVSNKLPLNELVVYSLPEGLWVFCITLTSKLFFVRIGRHQLGLIFLPLIFSIGLEMFQLIRLANGRFDLWDILMSVFCWGIAGVLPTDRSDSRNIVYPVTAHSLICIGTYLIVFLAHVWQ